MTILDGILLAGWAALPILAYLSQRRMDVERREWAAERQRLVDRITEQATGAPLTPPEPKPRLRLYGSDDDEGLVVERRRARAQRDGEV